MEVNHYYKLYYVGDLYVVFRVIDGTNVYVAYDTENRDGVLNWTKTKRSIEVITSIINDKDVYPDAKLIEITKDEYENYLIAGEI